MRPEICSACDGKGDIREDVGTHHSEYEYSTCMKCNGTGKVLRGVIDYTVPFDADISEVSAIQGELFKVIEKFKYVKKRK